MIWPTPTPEASRRVRANSDDTPGTTTEEAGACDVTRGPPGQLHLRDSPPQLPDPKDVASKEHRCLRIEDGRGVIVFFFFFWKMSVKVNVKQLVKYEMLR